MTLDDVFITSPSFYVLVSNGPRLWIVTSIMVILVFGICFCTVSDSHLFRLSIFESLRNLSGGMKGLKKKVLGVLQKSHPNFFLGESESCSLCIFIGKTLYGFHRTRIVFGQEFPLTKWSRTD